MKGYGIDHVHLRSTDPNAAARFYMEALGARETGRTEIRGALRLVLDLGGLTLFIEAVPPATPHPPEPPYLGLEHLGLRVPDLDAAAADLRSRGVRFVTEPREARPGTRIAFIEGPDGVRIELIERSTA
ncbi:VOC family protein [Roseomonas sp. HJA6]|uniref:VOC family protein n=1 Tax=Roseomonas alba TaxID=2846776 RepID=A0ABS7AC45_9PROT|nr:VOC family protein [Neoroseomonas alba]MBW6399868.1 VOC family protein [Neoroseomonas alba]